MSVFITTPNLESEPDDFPPGAPATLVLHLISTVPDGENANIVYTIETPGYTFGSGDRRLTVNAFVAGSGTTVSRTPYTLQGPDGGVNLGVSVTPADPPSTGATRVTVASAQFAGVAPGSKGPARAHPPTPGAAARKTPRSAKKPPATKRARTKATPSRRQGAKTSRAKKPSTSRKRSAAGRRPAKSPRKANRPKKK
jgi:hypothetical protein